MTENLMFGAAVASPSGDQQRRLDWFTMALARAEGLRGLPVLR